MAKEKRKASTVLLTMDQNKFAKVLADLKERHSAADEAAIEVANGYKTLKKQGVNLDALKLASKLVWLGNPAKVAAFLADFDRMRELAGLDAQLSLFEEDKTAPQKAAEGSESAKVVPIKARAEKAQETPTKADKPVKKPRAEKGQPVTKKALFDTGSGDGASDAEVDAVSDEEKARQAGMVAGAAGEDYANPHDSGPLRDAWHSGFVAGSDAASAEPAEKASA